MDSFMSLASVVGCDIVHPSLHKRPICVGFYVLHLYGDSWTTVTWSSQHFTDLKDQVPLSIAIWHGLHSDGVLYE